MGRWPSVLLWLLLLCAAPARAQINADVSRDTSKWFNRTHRVSEITVRSKRGKYSRKDNPAVELMKKVIAAKKRTDLANRDFYRYRKYQKLTFAANDVEPADFQSGLLSKIPGLYEQIELCPYNDKLILPVTVNETVTRRIYRKRPRATRDIVEARNARSQQTSDRVSELLLFLLALIQLPSLLDGFVSGDFGEMVPAYLAIMGVLAVIFVVATHRRE